MKTCNKCSETKEIIEFVKDRSTCKVCRKMYIDDWRKKNAEQVITTNRQYKIDNKEVVLKQKRERYARPEVKLVNTLRNRYSDVVITQKSTSKESQKVLGCTIKEYRSYVENLFLPGMSWSNHGFWHLDHIKPLASFDLTDHEEVKKAFHFSNTQPLWAVDNLKKGAKYEIHNKSI